MTGLYPDGGNEGAGCVWGVIAGAALWAIIGTIAVAVWVALT